MLVLLFKKKQGVFIAEAVPLWVCQPSQHKTNTL